jgi:hypothetical protein
MTSCQVMPYPVVLHWVVVPFQGDTKPPSLNIWWSVDRLGICVIEILHGVDCFYHDMLILCQSHHSVYVCIPDRATVSSDDGTDSTTWVHAVRCAWAPVAMSRHARRLIPPLPEVLGLVMLIRCWKPESVFVQRPESCPGSRREAGQANRWWNSAHSRLSYGEKVNAWFACGINSF